MDKPITVDDILKKENVLLSSHECNRCKKKFIAVIFKRYFSFLAYIEKKYKIKLNNNDPPSIFEQQTWYRCYDDIHNCKKCNIKICYLCMKLYYNEYNIEPCYCKELD